MPPKKKQEEAKTIGLEDVFEGVQKATPPPPPAPVEEPESKEPVRRKKVMGPPRDLELDKKKCLEKLEIIERLKQARISRGAAPKEEAKAMPPPAAAPPVIKEAPKPAPVAAPAVVAAPPPPPPPAPPKKIIKSTFSKPIWG